MMGLRTAGLAGMAALLIASCSSPVKLDEAPVETRNVASDADAAAAAKAAGTGGTGSAAASQVATVDLSKSTTTAAASGLPRVIYFDFDSFVIKDEYRDLISSYAKTLSANKSKRMVVEGHTDERGGREYNLALGQKRAEAVVKSLTLLGAADGQLEAVSFGKERPVDEGHDEAAWAKNRRAELKDR
jgi:peptidoglycan-associated lipoprotein